MINVVTNYKWTTTTGKPYLEEAPRIFAKTYEIDTNEALQALENWTAAVFNASKDYKQYYDGLHKPAGGKPKEEWVFPFFDDKVRSFTNEWGDSLKVSTDGSVAAGSGWAAALGATVKTAATTSGVGQAMVGAVIPGLNSQPGSLFEPPKFYQYSASDNALTVEFILINTESQGDAEKNYSLVKRLIEENRFSRSVGLTVAPPYLWEVKVPGYRNIRWASCNVDVTLLGKRLMVDSKIIPEGYRVGLTFTSLYTEPREFMQNV